MVKTEPPVTVDPELRLWLGGPVEPQRTWVLMADAHGPDEEQREICPGVLLSVSHELTMQLLQTPPSSRARVVVGYAGWGPGQLDQELASAVVDHGGRRSRRSSSTRRPTRCGRRRFAASVPTRRAAREWRSALSG